MPEGRISKGDVALRYLAGASAVALFLLAPQLSADTTGRAVTVGLSTAIFACSVHPILHSPWLRSKVSRKIVLCFYATGIAALGCIFWPYSLNISPTNVRFANTAPAGQIYSFRFSNRSAKDLYASQLKFRVHSQRLSGRDFLIGISPASRKAYGAGGAGAPRFADIQGLLCRDSFRRSLFSIYVYHLAPHESRDITITNRRAGSAKIGATTGFFTTSPQPPGGSGDFVSGPPGSDEALSDCQPFGFLVDTQEHEGMYWFNREGGKLDGKLLPQD